MKLSIFNPYRNRDVAPFEHALKYFEMQTVKAHEIYVVDLQSDEPYRSDMEELCKQYPVRYEYLDLGMPAKALDVFLWMTFINYGIRRSRGDYVTQSGIDRIWDVGTVESMLNMFAKYKGKNMVCGTAWRIKRLPAFKEYHNNFWNLSREGKSKGGYAFISTSKEWWHKVQGVNEELRWYADLAFIRRAKKDGRPINWINKRSPKEGNNMIIHIANHKGSRRRHGGVNVREIARDGKRFLRKPREEVEIVGNDEDWGLFTEKKLNQALRLAEEK